MPIPQIVLAQQYLTQADQLLSNLRRSMPYMNIQHIPPQAQRQMVMAARLMRKAMAIEENLLSSMGCENVQEDDGSY